jgi:hypothetical protein
MSSVIQRFGKGMAAKWCRVMHPDPMWPVSGMYQCPRCLRKYPVPWEQKPAATAARTEEFKTAPLKINEAVERVHA